MATNTQNMINGLETNALIRQVQAQIDGAVVISSEPSTSSALMNKKSIETPVKEEMSNPMKRKAELVGKTVENKKNKTNATNYCQPCDLELTSIQHAKQHYAGRKHRNVVEKMAKPSGMGAYNAETGSWMRNMQHVKKVENDGRFGIGEAFKLAAQVNFTPANYYVDITPIAESVQGSSAPANVPKPLSTGYNSDKNVLCKVCNIYVSSAKNMDAHEKGLKHMRNLKLLSTDPAASNLPAASADKSIYGSLMIKQEETPTKDWSMYRTPSGAYYCKACNINLTHEATLKQHLEGKKHLKREMEVAQKADVNREDKQ